MAASSPQTPAGDDRNLVTVDENYLAPSFEDRLQMFWDKHARTIVALVLIVVAALVARWGFGVFSEQREQAIRAEFAAAQTRDDLRAFIDANPTAVLAGVAALRLADEAYVAGNYADAKADYLLAARLMRGNTLGPRARLGAAMTPLLTGDLSSALSALQELADDTTAPAAVRAESAYHLAVLARDGGTPDQATRWTGVVLTVDPESIWAQRAVQLRSSLPPVPSAGASSNGADSQPSAAGDIPASVAYPVAK